MKKTIMTATAEALATGHRSAFYVAANDPQVLYPSPGQSVEHDKADAVRALRALRDKHVTEAKRLEAALVALGAP